MEKIRNTILKITFLSNEGPSLKMSDIAFLTSTFVHQPLYTNLFTPTFAHRPLYTDLCTPTFVHQPLYTNLCTPKICTQPFLHQPLHTNLFTPIFVHQPLHTDLCTPTFAHQPFYTTLYIWICISTLPTQHNYIYCSTYLKQLEEVVCNLLNVFHVTNFCQYEIVDFVRKRHLGVR